MSNPGSYNYEEKTLPTPSQLAGIAAITRAQRNEIFHNNFLVQQSNETSSVDTTPVLTSSPNTSVNSLQGELSEEDALALALRNSMNVAETSTAAATSVLSNLNSCSCNTSETNQASDSIVDSNRVLISSPEVPLDVVQGELSEDEALAIALQNSVDIIEPSVDVMASFNSNILSDQLSALTVEGELSEEDEALARAVQNSIDGIATRYPSPTEFLDVSAVEEVVNEAERTFFHGSQSSSDVSYENLFVNLLYEPSLPRENIPSSRLTSNALNTVQGSLSDDEALAIALQISEEDTEPSVPSIETPMPETGGKESPTQTSLECNICLEAPKDAVVSFCGHLFCRNCLFRWIDTNYSSKTCPVCKTPINKKKVIRLYGTGKSEEKSETGSKTDAPVSSQTNNRVSSAQEIESTPVPAVGTVTDLRRNQPVLTRGGLRGYSLLYRPIDTSVKFNPPTGVDTMMKDGVIKSITVRYQCITLMEEYKDKSLEELRVQDYFARRRNGRVLGAPVGLLNRTTLPSPTIFGSIFQALNAPRFSFSGISLQNRPLFGTTGVSRPTGPSLAKFVPVTGSDVVNGASITTKHQCITCMTAYEDMSFEELRVNYYACNQNGVINFATPAQTPSRLFVATPAYSFGSNNSQTKPLFEITNSTSFGTVASTGTTVKFTPTSEVEENADDGCSNVTFQCITFMKEYKGTSFEELRLDDYISGRKGGAFTVANKL